MKSEPKSAVSIVVPTYHEVENIRPLVRRINAALAALERPYEVIIVDDDSRDGIDRVARELTGAEFPVRLITRVGERGLGTAVLRGFAQARGETLVCMDADLSHPPEAIPTMLRCLAEPGVDFVLGSRYVFGGSTDEHWGVWSRIQSRFATLLARPFTSVKDPMSGFFAISRGAYERAQHLNPIGYKIALELIVKCRCSAVKEIPIHFAKRQFGQSKLGMAERWRYVRHLGRLLRFKLIEALKSRAWAGRAEVSQAGR
ncbi:MAG TPA: polyprenol monophosphomannose synthase [Candidatus Eisenbacteria bacterium]|nr:polyprenol monophosphomannose synthase [Candidatus Eisenbacteria bacterium]